jgi:hypothetical protein
LQIFALASLITGIIVASFAKGDNRAFGFVAIWFALLVIATSSYGTHVLRRQQSAFAVGKCFGKLCGFSCVDAQTLPRNCVVAGLMTGLVGMLSQTGLVLFATFVGLSKKQHGRLKRSYEAMAAWCFLVFFVYVSERVPSARYICLQPAAHNLRFP